MFVIKKRFCDCSKISKVATILTDVSICECFVLCESFTVALMFLLAMIKWYLENCPFCVCTTLTNST